MTDYYEENNSISKESQEKYLTFFLEKEEFAVNIAGIKEIIGVVKINKVPNTPTHIKGVINLRGKIIPVIDLRLKFEIPPVPYDETTCIIISEIKKNEKLLLTGLIVDSVSEVITIEPEDIENESLNEFGQILGKAINVLLASQDDQRLRQITFEVLYECFKGKGVSMEFERSTSMYEEFHDSNSLVSKLYLDGGELFPRPQYKNSISSLDDSMVVGVVDVLSIIMGRNSHELSSFADLLRDTAISLESESVNEASFYMTRAAEVRPLGDFINKKKLEYKMIIES